MYIFTCKPDFESMMTCIYDVWAARYGSANVRLCLEPIGQQDLFSAYIPVEAAADKVEKVIRAIKEKISYQAYHQIYMAAMSDAEDRLDTIYRFMRLGFAYGHKTLQMLGEAPVMRLFELSRRSGNEAHAFREFLRFTRIDPGVYVAHIEPACNIAHITARHFAERMPSEHWMIIDDKRHLAVVHPKDEAFYLTPLSEEDFQRLKMTESRQDFYTDLWFEFFDAISIKERENPRCQRNLFPLHYRKHAAEFQHR